MTEVIKSPNYIRNSNLVLAISLTFISITYILFIWGHDNTNPLNEFQKLMIGVSSFGFGLLSVLLAWFACRWDDQGKISRNACAMAGSAGFFGIMYLIAGFFILIPRLMPESVVQVLYH